MPTIPFFITALFVLLTAGLVAFVVACVLRGVEPLRGKGAASRAAWGTGAAMLFWLTLTGGVAATGFLADFESTPPRIALAIVPAFVAVAVLAGWPGVRRVVPHVPAAWLVYVQAFRIPLEGLLWVLYKQGVVPVQMTFEGLNFDVVTGLTALAVGTYVARGGEQARGVALAWNAMGLGLAFAIVVVSALSAPVPFRVFMEAPANTFVAAFPFVWLPAFVVPLAVLFHLWSLAQWAAKARTSVALSHRATRLPASVG